MNIAYYLHDEKNSKLLESQLLWFKRKFSLLNHKDLFQLIHSGRSLSNVCHLTIDDGWISTYDIIFPLLKKLDIPVSIFVSPKKILDETSFWYMEYKSYDDNYMKKIIVNKGYFSDQIFNYPLDLIFKVMQIDEVEHILSIYRKDKNINEIKRGVITKDQLLEMYDSGLVEVGAHTNNHPILANESLERSNKEIKDSIDQLSELLNKKVTSFAYPNGLFGTDFGNREINIVKKCGIQLAYSVDPGVITKSTNPYNIPRVGSFPRLKLGRLGLMLPSLHDQKAPRKQIAEFKFRL